MPFKRQTGSRLPGSGSRSTTLLLLGVGMMLLVPSLRLDRRELSVPEASFAQAGLGPLEHDPRGANLRSAPGPTRLLSSWAMIVGTTERPLKLLAVLGLLLLALVSAEGAVRLASTAQARPIVYLLFAASPFLNRSDLLHPDLLAAWPLVGLFASAVFVLGGSFFWLIPGLLGGAVAPFFGGSLATLAVLLPPAAALARVAPLGPARGERDCPWWRGALGALCVWIPLGAAAWGRPMEALAALGLGGRTRLVTGLTSPSSLLFFLACGTALVALALLLGNPRERPRAVRLLAIPAAVVLAVSTPKLAGGAWGPLVLLLPALALLAAPGLARASALARFTAVAVLFAAALLPLATAPPPPADVFRRVLLEAREEGRSGGRLIVHGPTRFGVIFYGRRGHDPGMPVISIPEDTTFDRLEEWLRERMRLQRGVPHPEALPVLIHPPPREPPPGFDLEPLPGRSLARLRLSS